MKPFPNLIFNRLIDEELNTIRQLSNKQSFAMGQCFIGYMYRKIPTVYKYLKENVSHNPFSKVPGE